MTTIRKVSLVSAILVLSLTYVTNVSAKSPPFGGKGDVSYAKTLWKNLKERGYTSTHSTLYEGGPPHGAVREVLEGKIHGKRVIVKNNYGGKGITVDAVKQNRAKWLKAITVMMKREDGYDPEDKNWFWAKYKPDGSLHKNKKGMLLAGRIAKGMNMGCIACHSSASGNDLVFTHNKETNAPVKIIHE